MDAAQTPFIESPSQASQPQMEQTPASDLNSFDVALFSEFSDSAVGNSPLKDINSMYEFSQTGDVFQDILSFSSAEYSFPARSEQAPVYSLPSWTHQKGCSLNSEDTQGAEDITLDPVILDEFLWLFRDHVAPWLAVFRSREIIITRRTRKEWYLAMAGLGALYCPVQGSWPLAQSLFHCSWQNLVLFTGSCEDCEASVLDRLVTVETLILLEMFGYLSGDDQVQELMDAIHSQMFQLTRGLSEPDVVDGDRHQRLVETLHLCEAYRLIMLQRTPAGPMYRPSSVYPDCVLRRWTTPAELPNPLHSAAQSIHVLCVLSLFTWAILPQTPEVVDNSQPLWSRTFCELILAQWARTTDSLSDWSTRILFHGIHVNFLVKLAPLEHALADSGGSAFNSKALTADCIFIASGEQSKAVWHAHQIVRLAVQTQSDKPAPSQGPHVSYCVYVATIILCYNALLEKDKDAARQWAKLGIQTLQKGPCSAVPVTGHFRSNIENLQLNLG
ncbi:hypothetical protein BJX99DRAFT_253597 [Aspergillus californicus]